MAQPNMLLITTDQQRYDTLQSAGNDHIWTPHLNWLADSGIRFERAYSDCPVCLPARLSILTGRHAYRHGVMSNKYLPQAVHPSETLPALLGAAGYQTRLIGKAGFGPRRQHQGFQHMVLNEDHDRFCLRHPEIGSAVPHGMGNNENAPAINNMPYRLNQNTWLCDQTLDFLETRDPSRPFFTWLSFDHPHPPFTPSLESWTLYQNQPMPPRVTGDWSVSFERIPKAFTAVTRELSMTQRYSDRQLEQIRRAYYACITEIDYQLGRVFGGLRVHGLLENTWILFTTDHGEMLGDHYLGGKCVPLEPSAHIPFLVRPPAALREFDFAWRGSINSDLVCLADIYTTALKLGQASVPAGIDGRDLSVVLNGGRIEREELYISCMYLHAVLKGDWKLCRETLSGHELLFDLKRDPEERYNLLDAAKYAEIREDLRERMRLHLECNNLLKPGSHDPAILQSDEHLPHNTCPGIVSGR